MIDDGLKGFIESGVSVVIGTRDEALVPDVVRGWGPRVSVDRRSISVCVPEATSARARTNLEGNGQIAVACSLPSNYKTVQLKGRYVRATEPSAAELLVVDRHREAFALANAVIGLPHSKVEVFWSRELVGSSLFFTIHFEVLQVFNQTPGQAAGEPL